MDRDRRSMLKVHGYLGRKRRIDWNMSHIPNVGDTVRFSETEFGKVTEIVWCMDEPDEDGQRVNISMEPLDLMGTAS